ncbi:hypothetical protein BASA81_008612 [Batrachochytrium salamandrivorans]|nr:hypothetical protein BASA81_008612 [Batrachochytrium salamandrivorans]
MEKLVADLSARYQIFGEGKHHPPERKLQESRAIANRAILECATSANPPSTPREPKVVFPDKFDGSRRHLRGSQPCASYVATFRQLATDLEWNDSALQAQFYWGLNSEVKDALAHFEQPTSLSDAMTLAIKIDNRIQERRREQTQSARPLSQQSSNYVPCPRRAPYQPREPNYQQQQQQQHQLQHQHQLRPEYQTNSSTPPAARQPDYMDVDLVRRGPLSSAERQHRMSQRLCLVCGQAGHIKATCPKSNSKFGTSKSVRAIQTSDNDDETSGNDQGCY